MKKLVAALAVAAALVMFVAASPAAALAKTTPTPKPAVHHVKKAAQKKSKPKPTPKPNVVTFACTGTDGGAGIDITYGNESSNAQGPSTLSGAWVTTMPYDKNAQYYDVTAQLQGSGQVTCSVQVQGVKKSGTASGGYNIANPEVVNTGFGWSGA